MKEEKYTMHIEVKKNYVIDADNLVTLERFISTDSAAIKEKYEMDMRWAEVEFDLDGDLILYRA